MKETTYICPTCKAICSAPGQLCASCGTYIHRAIEVEEEVFFNNGTASDLSLFIGDNSSRYMEIFRKNKGKRVFFHTNWAAFFLGVYWFFYRKMFLLGIAFVALNLAVSLSVTGLYLSATKDEVQKAVTEYTDAFEESSDETSEGVYSDIFAKQLEAEIKWDGFIRSYAFKFAGYLFLPSWGFSLLVSLVADCLYREHIKRKLPYGEGGVSKVAILPAVLLMWLSNGISGLITSLIIGEMFLIR